MPVRITLTDSPGPRLPFRYRLGDRVRSRASGHRGIIAGGVYRGLRPDVGGGPYQILYTVRRNDGLLFDASQAALEVDRPGDP